VEKKPFSYEDGTLTSNFKKARVALNTKYKSQIDGLYNSAGDNLNITKEILKGTKLIS
jgi:hypothetical protein